MHLHSRTINRAASFFCDKRTKVKLTAAMMNNQVIKQIAVLTAFIVILHNGYKVQCADERKKDLHFSFITALTGGSTSSGGIPIIDFALEQINNDSRLLPDYNLKYTQVLDSKVRWLHGYFFFTKVCLYLYYI